MKEFNNLLSIHTLKDKLENDSEFKRYRELGVKVHQNERLLALYERYISLQKEIVNLNYYKKTEAKAQKEAELQEIEEILFNNPLFNEYIQMQIELEELFQTMVNLIQDGVNTALTN